MRTVLSTALLVIALACGQAGAAEFTAAQAQQILSAAAQAKPNGEKVPVTLLIDGKMITFNVERDAVGNITAFLVPGADTGGINISLIKIGSSVSGTTGGLVPNSAIVINGDQSVVTYNLSLNADGTIAGFFRPGQTVVGQTPAGQQTSANPTANQQGGGGGGTTTYTVSIVLPAGTNPGQSGSPSSP